MGCKLEDAVENQVASLEEAVSPVPAVVLDDVVCFSLNPGVKTDEEETGEPPEVINGETTRNGLGNDGGRNSPHDMNRHGKILGHAEARERKHAV